MRLLCSVPGAVRCGVGLVEYGLYSPPPPPPPPPPALCSTGGTPPDL